MKKVKSKQVSKFVWCPSPITIDKSASWGAGNLQIAPNGAFLKLDNSGNVSHLVQPKQDGVSQKLSALRSCDVYQFGAMAALTEDDRDLLNS